MSFNDIATKKTYKQQTLLTLKKYTRDKNFFKIDTTITLPSGWSSPIAGIPIQHHTLVAEGKSTPTFNDLRVYDRDNNYAPLPFYVDGAYYDHCMVFVRLPVTTGTRDITLEFGNAQLPNLSTLREVVPALDPINQSNRTWVKASEPFFAHKYYPYQNSQNQRLFGNTDYRRNKYLQNWQRPLSYFASPSHQSLVAPYFGKNTSTDQPYLNFDAIENQSIADYFRSISGNTIQANLQQLEVYLVDRYQGLNRTSQNIGATAVNTSFRGAYISPATAVWGMIGTGAGDVTYAIPSYQRGVKRLWTFVYQGFGSPDSFISNRMQLRVNGTAVADVALPSFFDGNPTLTLGNRVGSGLYFDGQIYDCIIRQNIMTADRVDIEKMLLCKHTLGTVPTNSGLSIVDITDNFNVLYFDNLVNDVLIDTRENKKLFDIKKQSDRIVIDNLLSKTIIIGNKYEDWDKSDEVVRINGKPTRELEVDDTGEVDTVTIERIKNGNNLNNLNKFEFSNQIRSEDFSSVSKFITFNFEVQDPTLIDLANSEIELEGSVVASVAFEDFITALDEGVNRLRINTDLFGVDMSDCSEIMRVKIQTTSGTQKVYYSDFRLVADKNSVIQEGDEYELELAISDDNMTTNETTLVQKNTVGSIDTHETDKWTINGLNIINRIKDAQAEAIDAIPNGLHIEQSPRKQDDNLLLQLGTFQNVTEQYTTFTGVEILSYGGKGATGYNYFVSPITTLQYATGTANEYVTQQQDFSPPPSFQVGATLRFEIQLKIAEDDPLSTCDFDIILETLDGSSTVITTSTTPITINKTWATYTADVESSIALVSGVGEDMGAGSLFFLDMKYKIRKTTNDPCKIQVDQKQLYVRNTLIESHALSFDGVNYNQIAHNDTLNITGNVTLEAWIFLPTTGAGRRTIIAKDNGAGGANSTYHIAVGDDADNKWVFMHTSGSTTNTIVSTGAIEINTWTHVCAVKNGTNVTLYQNGIFNSSGTLAGATAVSHTQPVRIGDRSALDAKFVGLMHDVRIWNVARTGNEVYAPHKLRLTTATNLVANYHFSNPEEAEANDYSGNNFSAIYVPSGTYGSNFIRRTTSLMLSGSLSTRKPLFVRDVKHGGAVKKLLSYVTDTRNMIVENTNSTFLGVNVWNPYPYLIEGRDKPVDILEELVDLNNASLFYDQDKWHYESMSSAVHKLITLSAGFGATIPSVTLPLVDFKLRDSMILNFGHRPVPESFIFNSIVSSPASYSFNTNNLFFAKEYDYDRLLDGVESKTFNYQSTEFRKIGNRLVIANNLIEYNYNFISTLNPPTPPSNAYTNAGITAVDRSINKDSFEFTFERTQAGQRWLFFARVMTDVIDFFGADRQRATNVIMRSFKKMEGFDFFRSGDGLVQKITDLVSSAKKGLKQLNHGSYLTDTINTGTGVVLNNLAILTYLATMRTMDAIYTIETIYLEDMKINSTVEFTDENNQIKQGIVINKTIKMNKGHNTLTLDVLTINISALQQLLDALTITI
jgi:hypothetical protein